MIRREVANNFVFIIFGFMMSVMLIVGMAALIISQNNQLPKCAEDDIIVGQGQYYSNGTWQYYACQHIEIK